MGTSERLGEGGHTGPIIIGDLELVPGNTLISLALNYTSTAPEINIT